MKSRSSPRWLRRGSGLIGLGALLTLAIGVIDLRVPPGDPAAILYVIVVVLALPSGDKAYAMAATAGCERGSLRERPQSASSTPASIPGAPASVNRHPGEGRADRLPP